MATTTSNIDKYTNSAAGVSGIKQNNSKKLWKAQKAEERLRLTQQRQVTLSANHSLTVAIEKCQAKVKKVHRHFRRFL